MSEFVLRDDRDGVATLTLNRPEALNALNIPLFAELREHVSAIAEQTDSVGCVVLRGAGRAFSAGNDLKALGDPAPEPYYQAETIDMIEALPQPVIASVRGACYTGALELMLAAVSINMVAFATYLDPDRFTGVIFAIFVITVAAAEVGLALGIVLRLFRDRRTAMVDEASDLKW